MRVDSIELLDDEIQLAEQRVRQAQTLFSELAAADGGRLRPHEAVSRGRRLFPVAGRCRRSARFENRRERRPI